MGLRYPSELYEGVLAVGLFLALFRLYQRGLFPGGVTGLFLLVYPLIRVLVNLTRFPNGPWPWADQIVSLVVAAIGLTILLLIWIRQRQRPGIEKSSKVSRRAHP